MSQETKRMPLLYCAQQLPTGGWVILNEKGKKCTQEVFEDEDEALDVIENWLADEAYDREHFPIDDSPCLQPEQFWSYHA